MTRFIVIGKESLMQGLILIEKICKKSLITLVDQLITTLREMIIGENNY